MSPSDTDILTAEQQACWRYWTLATENVSAFIARNLARFGLSPGEYRVLLFLAEAPNHKRRMSDLSGIANHPPSRLSHMVRRLEERGLVTRSTFERDRRGTIVELSDAGYELFEEIRPTHQAAIKRAFIDSIGEADLATFRDCLERIFTAVTPVLTHADWMYVRGE